MSYILHIETSAKRCSVAISKNNTLAGSEGITSEEYVHAEMLHVLVGDLLTNLNLQMSDLNAVSVSRGPGSYTGLRIGVSAAKGYCYTLGIPLISVDTTSVIAHHASTLSPESTRIIAMIDARRMEVYCGIFEKQGKRISHDQAIIVDEKFMAEYDQADTVFAGDGAGKVNLLNARNAAVHCFTPSAEMMVNNVWERFHEATFENIASFEPYYLKDYLPGITKKTLV